MRRDGQEPVGSGSGGVADPDVDGAGPISSLVHRKTEGVALRSFQGDQGVVDGVHDLTLLEVLRFVPAFVEGIEAEVACFIREGAWDFLVTSANRRDEAGDPIRRPNSGRPGVTGALVWRGVIVGATFARVLEATLASPQVSVLLHVTFVP